MFLVCDSGCSWFVALCVSGFVMLIVPGLGIRVFVV